MPSLALYMILYHSFLIRYVKLNDYITNKEWLILLPFVAQGKMGRPRTHDIRRIINAIRYVMKSGCQWRLLPKEFPLWQTVYDYYLRWRKNGK